MSEIKEIFEIQCLYREQRISKKAPLYWKWNSVYVVA